MITSDFFIQKRKEHSLLGGSEYSFSKGMGEMFTFKQKGCMFGM